MKILYATYRFDPKQPDLGSGRDYESYRAMIDAGHDVQILGPVTADLNCLERFEALFWRIYKQLTGRSGQKYLLTTSLIASKLAKKASKSGNFDLIFSAFFSFFVFHKPQVPSFWFFDTTFHGQEEDWPIYGKLALKLTYWQEKTALNHVDACATNSDWSKQQLLDFYGWKDKPVTVFPMPSALPMDVVEQMDPGISSKQITLPIKLLVVGRVFQRKGLDVALEVVRLLNARGVSTELIICGLPQTDWQSLDHVTFVGPYKKSDSRQLQNYMNLYRWAHLLIHPARFEAAGIVPSEAAAFGTPTITNDVGGLSTSVKDGVSGIVLPKGSPPEAYVQAIIDLANDPDRYKRLCQTTRERYERELNWGVAGPRLVAALESAVEAHRARSTKSS